jgi:toxin ParE1/3/4
LTTERLSQTRLTLGAEQDVEAIFDYALEHRSAAQANALLEVLLNAIATLERLPERGAAPRELVAMGITDYRQIVVAPYRIIYRIVDLTVFIFVIADGRRDMQSLLERRLFSR